ncbi:Shikimate kinase, chloroplastic isoform C [Glycine soja]|uniref:Shikimate kinase, chloroplastic isoform C n=1 Tax=Glycine soja TaxID=3848 RepID=A0A445FS44_GLYSO|nr:Shikimate kinase, chloroplastic isoform C [Glycine soja]
MLLSIWEQLTFNFSFKESKSFLPATRSHGGCHLCWLKKLTSLEFTVKECVIGFYEENFFFFWVIKSEMLFKLLLHCSIRFCSGKYMRRGISVWLDVPVEALA